MSLLPKLVLLFIPLVHAQNDCSALFVGESREALTEFIEFEASVSAMPGGNEKRLMLRELHLKRDEIKKTYSDEVIEAARRPKEIRVVPRKPEGAISILDWIPVASQSGFQDQKTLYPQDISSQNQHRFEPKLHSIQWRNDEQMFVIQGEYDARALDVRNLETIGAEKIPLGLMSHDGGRYAYTSEGHNGVTPVKKTFIKSFPDWNNLAAFEHNGTVSYPALFKNDEIAIIPNLDGIKTYLRYKYTNGRVLPPETLPFPALNLLHGEVEVVVEPSIIVLVRKDRKGPGVYPIHPAKIQEFEVSPDTEKIIIRDFNEASKKWYFDVVDLKTMTVIVKGEGDVHFSPRGNYIYKSAYDTSDVFQSHYIFDLQHRIWHSFNCRGPIQFFSKDEWILRPSPQAEGEFELLSMESRGGLRGHIEASFRAKAAGASPSGRFLLMVSDAGELSIWEKK